MPYKDPVAQKAAVARSALQCKLRRFALVQDFKAAQGCAVCGEKDPIVLDLHHLDPLIKIAPLSRMVNGRSSYATIRAELEKCVVLCANCHRREHAKADDYAGRLLEHQPKLL